LGSPNEGFGTTAFVEALTVGVASFVLDPTPARQKRLYFAVDVVIT
jgi:hypothetical protein